MQLTKLHLQSNPTSQGTAHASQLVLLNYWYLYFTKNGFSSIFAEGLRAVVTPPASPEHEAVTHPHMLHTAVISQAANLPFSLLMPLLFPSV